MTKRIVSELELENCKIVLSEDQIEGFLERPVSAIGTSGKADIPGRFMSRRVCVKVTKNKGKKDEKKGMK
jgi:putative transposon-encoded protein